MKSDTVIKVNIILKKHIKPSYQLIFSNEEKVEEFIASINNDVDYVRIGDEVIERKTIKKAVIING